MNLTKAEQLLQQDLDDPGSVDITDLNQAQQLGIEGLAFLTRWRDKAEIQPFPILPSETTD